MIKMWLRAYKQAKEHKAKEAKYLASRMYRLNVKGIYFEA